MFNSLFGLGIKQPVFGGGGEGGNGGGGGSSTVTRSSRNAPQEQPTRAARPVRTAQPFLNEELTFRQAQRQARRELGRNQQFEYGGNTYSTTYGQDYNGDGRISFGETLRDMTDRGGPGRSGGVFEGGGMLSSAANALTGSFGYDMDGDGRVSMRERAIDMTNGGGAGRAGSRFVGGGTIGMLGNLMGGPGDTIGSAEAALYAQNPTPPTLAMTGGLMLPGMQAPAPVAPAVPAPAPTIPAVSGPMGQTTIMPQPRPASLGAGNMVPDYISDPAVMGAGGLGGLMPTMQQSSLSPLGGIMSLPLQNRGMFG